MRTEMYPDKLSLESTYGANKLQVKHNVRVKTTIGLDMLNKNLKLDLLGP